MIKFRRLFNGYISKNEATTNVKLKEVLKKLKSSIHFFMRDGKLTTVDGIVNLHATAEGTPWVTYLKENHYVSYACTPPILIQILSLKRMGNLFFRYKIQEKDSYCAGFCFSIFYLPKKF